MSEKIALVITSISGPNKVMKELAMECKQRGHQFIVIGDETSPKDFHIDGCDYYSLERQVDSGFEFAKFAQLCPTRHYARKSIGYLVAIAGGASIIVETDDDNFPYESFWQGRQREQSVVKLEGAGWVNVYRYFTESNIWPRGMPLERLGDELVPFESLERQSVDCPIQQGLADENPDVDAIYRLTMPLPQNFRKDRRILLAKNTWCPFNSQNTSWWPDAFGVLYMPSYCSIRMTDIWRGFVAQRIAWANGWGVLFHEPTVWQERNEHNLMRDFKDEIPGYLNNAEIGRQLEGLSLEPGVDNIPANLKLCYEKLVEMGLVGPKELDLIDIWNGHIEQLLKNRRQ